ncbi:MAG TPA: riboflavin synthase [Candidatus Dormibacteraeota bacterium]|nr:riboflavin synthase [Candidatus Dormibacteraeota bacterium]
MFSGIVAEVGTIAEIADGVIRVNADAAIRKTEIGGSVAVNGVCLTAASVDEGGFTADVMPETLRRTALGRLGAGSRVNLEPALAFGEEVGGHLVQGHVDGTGRVVSIRDEGNARWVTIEVPEAVRPYCVLKGSIAIDGASLTIAAIDGDGVAVSLIPHTLQSTIAGAYEVGSEVNLEADMLAKYVATYVNERDNISTGPTGNPGGHPSKEAG